MGSARYCIVLTGKTLDGVSKETLTTRLQAAFKLSPEQAQTVLAKAPRVIKRDLDEAQAQRLAAQLAKLGAHAVVRPETAQAETAKVTPPTTSPTELLASLASHKIPHPPTTPLYTVSLLLVTLLCLLIPPLYMGLIGLLGAGLWWWESGISATVEQVHSGVLLFVMYGVPLVAGCITLLFLLKPLLARSRVQPAPHYELNAKEEPELVAGIQALCKAIGIRAPGAIHLSYEVNASAHFKHGWLSLFTNSKVLTIGLPLAAGMTSQQLVGVLAHEFGHFAQGMGMRCSYVINSVNGWLASRAYEQDEWDLRLHNWQREYEDGYVQLIVLMAALGVWLSRLVLRLLFQISFRLSQHLSREMEFDADRYGAVVAGSACFRDTSLRVRALGQAFQEADQKNAQAFHEGKLLADMPQAVAQRLAEFTPAEWDGVASSLTRPEQTRYWDSHPADQARIDNVEREGAPGFFLDNQPASALFRDFALHCKRVTVRYYKSLGLEYKTEQLVETRQVMSINQQDADRKAALERYFNDMYLPYPLLNPQAAVVAEISALGWQGVIDELRRTSPEIKARWQQANAIPAARKEAAIYLFLKQASIPFQLADGKFLDGHTLHSRHEDMERGKTAEHQALARAFGLFGHRLQETVASMTGTDREQAEALMSLLTAMATLGLPLSALEDQSHIIAALQSGLANALGTQGTHHMERLEEEFRQKAGEFLWRADHIAGATVAELEPLANSLGAYLRSRCPLLNPQQDALSYYRAAKPLLAAFAFAHESALTELVLLCERAEAAAGIKPIKLVLVRKTADAV